MSFLPSDAESSDIGDDGGSSFAPSCFQGYLQKKSPGLSFFGKRMWQRRYFVLEASNLAYHTDKQSWAKGEQPIGVVRVDMIRDIQLPLGSAHYGYRFDILAMGGHLFELMAPSEKSCTQWVQALREEIGKRAQSVNEALRTIKDEHVADGFWKTKGANDVKKLHSHAEAALPTAGGRGKSRQASRQTSRENSRNRSTYLDEDDEEEMRDRAAALAVMMQEESDARAAASGGPKRTASSVPVSAGNTPPAPPAPVEDEETAEQRASNFLKRQYTLGAVKAVGRSALSASIVSSSGANVEDIEAQLPASQRGAARNLAEGGSASVGGSSLRHTNSHSEHSPAAPSSLSDNDTTIAEASAVSSAPPVRRPIASYGDDDSDSGDDAATSSPRGQRNPDVRVNTSPSPASAVSVSPPAFTSSSLSPAAISPTAAAAVDDTPFISTVLWKESPSGFIKVWQKRLFALQDSHICYYKKADDGLKKNNLAGSISIHQINKVIVHEKRPCDFHLFTSEGRIYKLRSESEEVTRQWVAFIQACDPRRLGTTFPGLVVRETKAEQVDAAATGAPARGRLVASTTGRTTMSVAPPTSPEPASSSSPAAGLPTVAPPRTAAQEEIEEEKTFWNFLRNKHSFFSLFYVKKKASFPRSARWFLFILDLLMNLFFVFVFIIQAKLTAVQQVVVIIVILISIEMILAMFLKWFCYSRDVGPIEGQIRLGVCAAFLYAMFLGLTAWKWTQLPERSAIIATVRFVASSIGVVGAEAAVWAFLYNCAQQCCPCITLDDGSKSLDDLASEEEERVRYEREKKHKGVVEAKRAKIRRQMELKLKKASKSKRKADEQV